MSKIKKILTTPLRIAIIVILFGVLAKMFELSYAKEIMFYGFLTTGILYPIRFLKKQNKHFVDCTKLALVFFFSLYGIFTILEFPFSMLFLTLVAITFLMWFVMEGTAYFLDDDLRVKNTTSQILWNCVLVIGTLSVIFGCLLQLLNWDYAIHLLTLGIVIFLAFILKDTFMTESQKPDKHNNGELQL